MMLRPLALVLLLSSVALAGCVGDDAPPAGTVFAEPAARLLCLEGVCNYQATVDPIERQANELTVAVNPTDPMNIIASGKDYTPDEAGDCVRDGIYTTFDGGLTWTNANLAGSPWRLLGSDPASFEPHIDLSLYWCATDPVVAFGPDGTAYWTVMPYQCDAISGSKFGREFVPGTGIGHPDGGFNDHFWTCSSMYVLVSNDGGLTWPTVRQVAVGPRLEHDKQWLSVAPDGTVLLCWDRDPSYQITGLIPDGVPEEGPQTLDPLLDPLLPDGVMSCATSSDKGLTWSENVDVNPEGTWTGFIPWVDWGPDNTAWMTALDGAFFGGGDIIVSHSPDGLSWGAPTIVGQYENPPAGGEYGWPVLEGSDFRMFAVPALAVDRSAGPHGGNIYVTWFDHSSGDGDILVAVSRDDGATWSDPVRIHDDNPGDGFDQFMSAISVGPDGTVDVVWYDRRDDADNHLFDLYHTYSVDGGRSWAKNLRVSEFSSDEQYSHHQNGMVFMGDYIDMDSSWGRATPVWVDTRNGKADAFIAHIERPSANGEDA